MKEKAGKKEKINYTYDWLQHSMAHVKPSHHNDRDSRYSWDITILELMLHQVELTFTINRDVNRAFVVRHFTFVTCYFICCFSNHLCILVTIVIEKRNRQTDKYKYLNKYFITQNMNVLKLDDNMENLVNNFF